MNNHKNIPATSLKFVLQEKQSLTQDEQKKQLALAAITAISDYAPDGELNVFSNLEGEDFYQDIEIIGNIQ
ncbi:hypothetical protein [Anabaena sp. 4-3]|uniref:hypothetical protein n=1 Tax=Anabaena sp. 4-3 TaxID=1811979 RepID=UPI00082E9D19|nr:hypothetical protein [Anabaena sp. 4-3]